VTSLVGNAAKGLPGLTGVLLGLLLYSAGGRGVLTAVCVLGSATVLLLAGRRLLGTRPRLGLALIEVWILAAILVVAFSTAAIVWLTVRSPSWFSLEESQQEALSGALVGGVTAYLALLWTQDIAVGDGFFWPGTQFREGLRAAFATHLLTPPGDTREYDAIYEERVRSGETGWGFRARWQRAGILQRHLRAARGDTGGRRKGR
jgi:hypothetical protein